ncbi:MAG: 50S ribosomal protein L11 methyltransferase [bacterium]
MKTWKVTWGGSKQALGPLDILLTEIFYPPANAVALIKSDPNEESDPDWRAEAYFTEKPNMTVLSSFLSEHAAPAFQDLQEIEDKDWVAHSLEGLGIVTCGRFVLYGIHDQDRLPQRSGDIPIRIDANQAFGTGHHPTTAGCLTMLDSLIDKPPQNILDLGTGSAILAIAARKIWPDCKILASDIDPTSVEIAGVNAQQNNAPNINFVTAAGFDHPDIISAAPFDFIFANILAGPLTELAPAMADQAAQGATIMLAGLLARQEHTIRSAYEQAGFTFHSRLEHDTWPILLFTAAI